MVMWSRTQAPKYYPTAVATSRGWETADGEVLVTIANLAADKADLDVAPGFAAAFSAAATYSKGANEVMTLTISVDEEVFFTGTPVVALTLFGDDVRSMTFDQTSTGTSLKFNYVTQDEDPSGALVSTGATITGATFYDKATRGKKAIAAPTFVAPTVTTKSIVA